MGNSQSSNTSPRPRVITRQRSAKFSHISIGCTSSNSTILDPFHETSSYVNEKVNDDPQPVAYAPNTPHTQDDATLVYQAFLRMFPEYRQTWILDSLRRTDFARLDRTGETYVDYMGGALYPESLIRVHTTFLNNNILGNTHSASNR
jgi:molybdenum cofactor sulfurtransferase